MRQQPELLSPAWYESLFHEFPFAWPQLFVRSWGVNKSPEGEAWLEAADGKRHPIHGGCSIGRGPVNALVLSSPKVSRRHALIHLQNIGECWLIDFGSSNGTFLNKRRILLPVRLTDGDEITIGDEVLGFRQPAEVSDEYRTMVTQRTLHRVETIPCWLLVADIRNFTPLSRTLPPERLDNLLGAWLGTCREIIETHHGTINKFLGDGFLAYWTEAATTPKEIADVIAALKEFQQKQAPPFRVVLHFGAVAVGGVASLGEESLMGRDVNLVFRMEGLTGSLGEGWGLSEPAQSRLADLIPARPLGEHELKGFRRKCALFGC